MQIKLFSGKVQFKIDTRITLDVKGQLFGIRPFAVTPAVLAIAQRPLSVYDAYGIVFLPPMFQGLPFAGQGLIDCFLIEIPVKELVCRYTRLLIKQALDVFVRNIRRQGVKEFLTVLETLKGLVNGCFAAIAAAFSDLTVAEMVHKVKPQYFFVVHS